MSTQSTISGPKQSDFSIIETMLWEPSKGYFLLQEHLRRLEKSADFFSFPFCLENVQKNLLEQAHSLEEPHKIRLLLSKEGQLSTSLAILDTTSLGSDFPRQTKTSIDCSLAQQPVDSSSPFLFHKTTVRQVYNRAKENFPDVDDVILYNEKGELTETCTSNLIVQIDRELWTPTLSCGLLPGTMRAHLLTTGEIKERIMPLEILSQCEALYAINSVRRARKIEFKQTGTVV